MPWILKVVLIALVALAAFFDLRSRRIPNWLTLAGVLAGVGLNAFLFEMAGLAQSLKGLALAFGLYFVFWMLRAMGAGDVKLMAAVGAFVGPGNWLQIFLLTALLGGVIALALLLVHRRFREKLNNVIFILHEIVHLRPPYWAREELSVRSAAAMKLPHGAVIGLGCVAFLALGSVLAG